MTDPDVCEWKVECPRLKSCKGGMVWNRYAPTAQERAADAAIMAARREYGKAKRHATRRLRIEADHAPKDLDDGGLTYPF